jgi:hypothetical protein
MLHIAKAGSNGNGVISGRGLRHRHYRKHRHDNAPARAFAGAKLWLRQPVVPATQAEAARLVGSTPAYVAAAAVVINAATPGLIENVLHGRVPLLEAAESVRKRVRLVKAYREADRDDRKALGTVIGVDHVFDETIAPSL